jgi:AraC-like DNA-binding protein
MNREVGVETAVSDYREFPPPLPLARHLLCLWTSMNTGSGDESTHPMVVPDGCIDIILINNEAPMVVGPWTIPFVARDGCGTVIVGARFHPGCGPGLLGLPASTLLNQSVPLNAIWSNAECAPFVGITDQQSLPARRSAMEMALLNRLTHADAVDETMNAAIQWLAANPHGRIEQLGEWIGLGGRQLQRRFATAVGYGPKLFQAVLRFQRLLHLAVRTSAPRNLAQFSADVGYADQAHMTREVRRFSGSPPTVALRSARCALRLSGLLKTAGHVDPKGRLSDLFKTDAGTPM